MKMGKAFQSKYEKCGLNYFQTGEEFDNEVVEKGVIIITIILLTLTGGLCEDHLVLICHFLSKRSLLILKFDQ